MYPVVNALKNIPRQKKRYRLFIPLLLCCAVLSGLFLTIAAPCRTYADSVKTDPLEYTVEEAAKITAMEDHVRRTGQSAYKAQIGILVVGAAAVFYVSSLMIGERFTDVGILFSLGLTRGQIFVSLFIELGTVCVLSLGTGLWLGSRLGLFWLQRQIELGIFPEALADCIRGGDRLTACAAVAVGILLIPLLRLIIRLIRTDPASLLQDRT